MVESEIVPNTDENAEKCLCPGCPTHNECMKKNNEHFFCSRGNTECDIEKKGCIVVHVLYGLNTKLTDFYYCEKPRKKIV